MSGEQKTSTGSLSSSKTKLELKRGKKKLEDMEDLESFLNLERALGATMKQLRDKLECSGFEAASELRELFSEVLLSQLNEFGSKNSKVIAWVLRYLRTLYFSSVSLDRLTGLALISELLNVPEFIDCGPFQT